MQTIDDTEQHPPEQTGKGHRMIQGHILRRVRTRWQVDVEWLPACAPPSHSPHLAHADVSCQHLGRLRGALDGGARHPGG